MLHQLCRLFNNKNPNLFINRERVQAGVAVLLEVCMFHFLISCNILVNNFVYQNRF